MFHLTAHLFILPVCGMFFTSLYIISLSVQVYREKTGESEPLKDHLTLSELGFKVR